MRFFVSLVFLFLLSGCVLQPYIPPPSTAHYKTVLAAWQGKNISDIPPSWGTPAPPVATADGGKKVTWPNTPRWGCLTTAVADSSGTIRSWEVEGASCLADYSDDEIRKIKAKLKTVASLVRTLKRGDRIRLSFYEDAVDIKSERADEPVTCYFLSYSRIVQEITIRTSPEPQQGFTFGKDIYIYELRYISDITVLKPESDQAK